MRPLRWLRRYVPWAALTTLAVLALLAALGQPPPLVGFPAAPELPPLPRPDLGLGPATLHGTVVDEAGRTVADAGLLVLVGGRLFWTWSGGAGEFRLAGLPRDQPLEVAVVARGFEPAQLAATAGAAPARLTLQRRIDQSPVLPGLAALDLRGEVRFSPLESAAEGYEVALLPVLGLERLDAGFPRRVPVDAEGRFAVPALAPGEYEVLLLPPEARGAGWPNLLAGPDGAAPRHEQPAPDTPEAAAEGPGEPLRLELRSRAGAVQGRLADRRRAGGASWLAGAVVRLEPIDARGEVDPTRVLWAVSDADGGYRLRHVPPGRYRVSLAAGAERRVRDVLVRELTSVDPDL